MIRTSRELIRMPSTNVFLSIEIPADAAINFGKDLRSKVSALVDEHNGKIRILDARGANRPKDDSGFPYVSPALAESKTPLEKATNGNVRYPE